jgi:pimeloyl-ACP methyl ester carboxylesterase
VTEPEVAYAKSADVSIAYETLGEGPLDVVIAPGFISHLGEDWSSPEFRRFAERIASYARFITFDKRGTGLSDRGVGLPSLEERMDDVRAVMDAAGCERAALVGVSEGGAMSMVFSATYPERTHSLTLIGSFARFSPAPDYPAGIPDSVFDSLMDYFDTRWASGALGKVVVPSRAQDERFLEEFARHNRAAAAPGDAKALMRMNQSIDVRDVLPAIHVPTLVLHRIGDRMIPVEAGRYMAERIPGAKWVELPGSDHPPQFGDDAMQDEIQQFLTGSRGAPREPDRVLATVLFTDIVDSTARAAELGDQQWRRLIEQHHALVRRELERHRGKEIDTAGDGFFATFDGPARAVQCATGIARAVRDLGIEVRAGLHAGECELHPDGVTGLAVHIGSRIASLAGAGEVWVSSTVKDLVVGSGLEFEPRGTRELKGVPGDWSVYQASA